MDELRERLAQGDAAAFAELYDACADRLHHYVAVRLGSRDVADDVLQETFVRLVRTRHRLRRVENLTAYVFTTARNEAARYGGREARAARLRVPLPTEDLFAEADDLTARDLAPAADGGHVVWHRPRFEAIGKPPLLLRDYARFGPAFEVDYPSVFVFDQLAGLSQMGAAWGIGSDSSGHVTPRKNDGNDSPPTSAGGTRPVVA